MASSDVQVAVVGAGLAGLAAADRLHQAGVNAALYEANPERVGGRCWTAREYFENGQTGEHGPERIDTCHHEMRELAAEMGLELFDWLEDYESAPGAGTLVHDHHDANAADEADAAAVVHDAVVADMTRRGIPLDGPRGEEPSEAEIELDAISIHDWVEENIEGGVASAVGRAFVTEIALGAGREVDQLSACGLIGAVTGETEENDDRYQVVGGNDQIPNGLLARLPEGSVTMGAKLTKITRASDGGYELDFGSGASANVPAIILALPFTALRRADLSGAGFSAEKLAAIEEYDLGVLTKIIMQFNRPRSDFPDWDGAVITEDPRSIGLHVSGGQDGDSMIVTMFYGGANARGRSGGVPHAPASEAIVAPALEALDAVPGLKDAFTGLAWIDSWGDSEYAYGAYSSFQPGQATRFRYGRVAAAPEGGAFFAGEHTSIKHTGYMNGAVESGQRAAQEAIDHLG